MKLALIFIIGLLVFMLLPVLAAASDLDTIFNDIPEIQYYWPDTNFTFLSHAFPTTPRTQVLANGHLYVAFGAYLIIYEIQDDGTLLETCSKMMPYAITSMDHDDSYLYLTGADGLEIYEGEDYSNPQLVGLNPMRYLEGIGQIMADGDSLYYWWNDSSWGGPWPGIMDISDRSNPSVVYESETYNPTSTIVPPAKYDRYLMLQKTGGGYQLIILDLSHPSGNPEPIDSIQWGGRSVSVFENRLYICTSSGLKIYEFDNGAHPEFRSFIETGNDLFDIAEVEIDGTRYGFVCSWGGFLLKIDLSDLYNPVIVDSIMFPEELDHDFREIEQYGEYSYAMTSRLNYYVEHPGVHVIDWDGPNGPELIQSVQKYSYCNSVVVNRDAMYAGLEYGKFIVIDVADKYSPQVIDEMNDIITGWNPKLGRGYLYTLSGNTVQFYNVEDTFYPVLDWTYTFPLPEDYYINDYIVYDSLLIANYCVFGLSGPGGLVIANIADRSDPEVLYESLVEWRVKPLHLDYPLLYFPENMDWSVIVFDISNPSNPEQVNRIYSNNSSVNGAYTYVDYLYVLAGIDKLYRRINHGFQFLGEYYHAAQHCNYVDGKLFYFGARGIGTVPGLQVWDIEADPINPVYTGYLYHSSGSHYNDFDIDYPYVFIPGGVYGVIIAQYDDPTDVVEEIPEVPIHESILFSYPNPFNETTILSYSLLEESAVALSIYDILGRRVFLLTNDLQQAGEYTFTWDASDFPSGVYFARLKTPKGSQSIKMVLLQ